MEQTSIFQHTYVAPKKSIKSLGGVGILTNEDLGSLKGLTQKVYELMKDGQWHSSEEIRQICPQGSDYMRRLRTLRDHFTLERKRSEVGRLFFYRIK